MGMVWIVSERSQLEYPLDQLLQKRSDCEVHTMAELASRLDDFLLKGPSLLVVDLESIPQSATLFLRSLALQNPDGGVISVHSDRYPDLGAWGRQIDADDVIVFRNDNHDGGLPAEHLLRKVELFDRLATVQLRLRKEMQENRFIAKSKPMRDLMQRLPSLANTSSTVLITGETGTGKELIARAIHYLGLRAGKPFITLDCGSIPQSLIENELFGHVRGAYTDAETSSRGLIQEAHEGTLFLDEVEALPLMVQSMFLRFLQERQIKQLGQTRYSPVDVRVVAATNADLEKLMKKGLFREDLYYRLNVVPLFIPPLRYRRSDVPMLVKYFVKRYAGNVAEARLIPDRTMQSWMEYDWPGNVRELENKVQQWLADPDAERDSLEHPAPEPDSIPSLAEIRRASLEKTEREYLKTLLAHVRGNISAAARAAKIDRKSLRSLLHKHSLDPGEYRVHA